MILNEYMAFIDKISSYYFNRCTECTEETEEAVGNACMDIVSTVLNFRKDITRNKAIDSESTKNRREFVLLAEDILSLTLSEMPIVQNDLSVSEEYNKAYDNTVEYAADMVRMMFNDKGNDYITAKEIYSKF